MAFGRFMMNPFRDNSIIVKLYYYMFGIPILNMHLRWRAIKKIIKKLKSPILDVGCGNGAFSIETAIMTGNLVIGFDINREGILFAKRVANRKKVNNVCFLIADARKMPFKEEVFKSAICLEVLEHIEEDHAVLSEIFRVLRRDGQLIITSVGPSYTLYTFLPIFTDGTNLGKNFYREMDHVRDGYSIDILTRCLSDVGFRTVEFNEFIKFFSAIGVRFLDFLLHYRSALGSISEHVKVLLHPIFLILTKIDEFLPSNGKELVVLAVK